MNWSWLQAEWPAPGNVHALCTTRSGGCSHGPWSSMNLGARCGDDPARVRRNRERLAQFLPSSPQWLRQVHGSVVATHAGAATGEPEADALVAFAPGQVCAILTADCLPVVLCDRAGSRIAVAHAGWRGLAAGVLGSTVRALRCNPEDVMAWLGPAIGPAVYEVGEEVVSAFPDACKSGFEPRGDRWLMDLYAVARIRLAAAGVSAVFGGGLCTFSAPERFYSFRRDGTTGRMATLAWLSPARSTARRA